MRQDMRRGNKGIGWQGYGKAYPNARHERTRAGIASIQPVTDATRCFTGNICDKCHTVGLDDSSSTGAKLDLVGKSADKPPIESRLVSGRRV